MTNRIRLEDIEKEADKIDKIGNLSRMLRRKVDLAFYYRILKSKDSFYKDGFEDASSHYKVILSILNNKFEEIKEVFLISNEKKKILIESLKNKLIELKNAKETSKNYPSSEYQLIETEDLIDLCEACIQVFKDDEQILISDGILQIPFDNKNGGSNGY